MKTWVKILILMLLVSVVATLSVLCHGQRQRIKSLQCHVEEQSAIIDSLLGRRMTVFDVQLQVTDRSRMNVYGRYNRGTISVPSIKTYRLELDSVFNGNFKNEK